MKKIEIDHFKQFNMLAKLKANPRGDKLAFVSSHALVDDNKYESDIHIYDTKATTTRKMTSTGDTANYTWLDHETLLFKSVRSEEDKKYLKDGGHLTTLYSMNIDGGEANLYRKYFYQISKYYPLEDGRMLFVATYSPQTENLNSTDEKLRKENIQELKDNADFEVFEEIPFWSNGGGYVSYQRSRLYLEEKDGSIIPLTNELTDVNGVFPQDNGNFLLILKEYEKKMPIENSLNLLDISTMSIDELYPAGEYYMRNALTIDNETYVFASDMKSHGLNENGKFYQLTEDGLKCINDDFDDCLNNTVGGDIKYGNVGMPLMNYQGKILYLTTRDDSSHVFTIDPATGDIAQLTHHLGATLELAIAGDKVYTLSLKGLHGQELYTTDEGAPLTDFNKALSNDYRVSEPIEVTFTNAEGDLIKGWAIAPIGAKVGEKYPTILNIHGGPKTVYGTTFFHENQYWANEGFGVIYCNPTGSDGKGNKFMDIRGRYGTVDYNDIMMFTDKCIERFDWIDEERVGVTGGSYGGFMTNWIIGHTNRFKAAASQRSISNWVSKFNTTDIGYYFNQDQISATPWDNHDKLWWHSPIKYADQVTTPTLFIHSEEDYRCWVVEGMQMYTALQYHDVPTRMCMFRKENHELSRSGLPKRRIRRLQEITDWMKFYL